MKYLIQDSENAPYWINKPDEYGDDCGMGYTKDINKAGQFSKKYVDYLLSETEYTITPVMERTEVFAPSERKIREFNM